MASHLTTSKKVLDTIYNNDRMREIFSNCSDNEDILIDYDKISILGDSLSGSVSLSTAMCDQRITGVVVSLNPTVNDLEKEELLLCEFPRPLLCINSQNVSSFNIRKDYVSLILKNMVTHGNISIDCTVE